MTWEWAEERLVRAHNYWLAVNRDARAPYVRPVWCVWAEGALFFTTSPASSKARAFAADPQVSVQLELDREVVVVEGCVERCDPTAAAVAEYAAKYGWTPPPSQDWYAVRVQRLYASDEATYPAGGTTFEL
jgi:pyridoxine/pyridoxamine 5'-phosphate oxidase